ncbi:MAG: HAMP domain-containing histidine kinase [Anaerolineae bacterium]|nr:HAMP domain-containing histidine kinase [Anaerolineae bacterium]
MKPLRILITGIPLILAFAIFILIASGRMPDGSFDLRMDDGMLVLLGGVLLSALQVINFLSQRWLDRVHERSMEHAKLETAEEHRKFLNRLDHELKNPLMALRAGLSNLSDTHDETEQQKIIASLNAQTLRIGALVTDLRKVANIGTYPLELLPIPLIDLLRDVYSAIKADPLAAGRDVRLRLPAHDTIIVGDRDLLVLALHNLLSNALKYSQPNDVVELRGAREGSEIVLEVSDTGVGIPKQEQPDVWKELYRGHNTHSVQGSGIGLALVQAIVERHGGQVTLRSEAGQGTTVTICLPMMKAPSSVLQS